MRPLLLAGLLVGLPASAALPTPAAAQGSGGLTFYDARDAFDAAHPGLFVEDFEDVAVTNGISCWCTSPVDSNTDNECYDPGTLVAPLGLAAVGPTQHEFDALIALGPGYFGQPSIVAGANLEVDTTVVSFDPGVDAVGMEVYAFIGNPGITVDVYDTAGALLGSTTVPGDTTGTFFGVHSDGALIGAVYLDADEDYTMVDDVAYATHPVGAEPLPGAFAFDLTVHPNPLRGAGTVALTLGRAGHAVVSVYDALGREVAVIASGRFSAGRHEVALGVGPLPAGVYVVRVEGEGEVRTRRITLVR